MVSLSDLGTDRPGGVTEIALQGPDDGLARIGGEFDPEVGIKPVDGVDQGNRSGLSHVIGMGAAPAIPVGDRSRPSLVPGEDLVPGVAVGGTSSNSSSSDRWDSV